MKVRGRLHQIPRAFNKNGWLLSNFSLLLQAKLQLTPSLRILPFILFYLFFSLKKKKRKRVKEKKKMRLLLSSRHVSIIFFPIVLLLNIPFAWPICSSCQNIPPFCHFHHILFLLLCISHFA